MKYKHILKAKHREKSLKRSFFPEPYKDEEDVIKGEFHSLIIEEVPEEYLPFELEDGEIAEGIYHRMPPFKVYKTFIGDFAEEANGLHKLINKLSTKINPFDILELHIDSNGGSVNEGKLFYDIINNFEPESVYAYLNVGYSMGALLFCMPDTRIVHEMSDLMFHDYSTVVYGKAGDIETSHRHSSTHIRNFFKKFTVDKGFLTQEEFELMLVGKEHWMDAKEMCERGIATHVKTREGIIEAKEWLEKNYTKEVEKVEEPKPAKADKPVKPKTPRKTKAQNQDLVVNEPK